MPRTSIIRTEDIELYPYDNRYITQTASFHDRVIAIADDWEERETGSVGMLVHRHVAGPGTAFGQERETGLWCRSRITALFSLAHAKPSVSTLPFSSFSLPRTPLSIS